MKKSLCFVFLLTLSVQSHAGWLDDIANFFSGDDEKTEEAATNTPGQSSENSTAALVKTGITLIPMLMESLGISESQASGGLGALLSTAQSLMASEQFSSLASAIPNANSLMKAAPALSGSSSENSLVGNVMDMAGENGGALKAGANLVSQFSSLGLDSGSIGQFTGVVGDYLNQSNKMEEANSLTSVISGLL